MRTIRKKVAVKKAIKKHSNRLVDDDTFTKEEGLKIQAEQVKIWARVLNNRTLTDLEFFLQKENKLLKPTASGYDVFRGTSIDCWVANYAQRKTK